MRSHRAESERWKWRQLGSLCATPPSTRDTTHDAISMYHIVISMWYKLHTPIEKASTFKLKMQRHTKVDAEETGSGRLHANGYTLAHHLLSGSPRRSAHGGGTPGPGESAVTRLSA